jgi:hypothetical protein
MVVSATMDQVAGGGADRGRPLHPRGYSVTTLLMSFEERARVSPEKQFNQTRTNADKPERSLLISQ